MLEETPRSLQLCVLAGPDSSCLSLLCLCVFAHFILSQYNAESTGLILLIQRGDTISRELHRAGETQAWEDLSAGCWGLVMLACWGVSSEKDAVVQIQDAKLFFQVSI